MLWSKDQWNRLQRGVRGLPLLVALAGTVAMFAPPASAQEAPAPNAAAPQQGAAPAQDAWVKLCEKNAQTQDKEICLTHHERLDGNTGMVLVAAAIRKVEGEDTETFLVRLPTAIALAIPAGVQIRIDEGEPLRLPYTLCYATSCQAEMELKPELLKELRGGKQLVVAAVNLQRKAIGFPVPLEGFSKAYDGEPVDKAKYQEARRRLMEMIRKRQTELANKAAEAEAEKEGGGNGGGASSVAPKTAVPVE
ncbi:Invasion associated locus B (IalB) protein [Methyloligella halotolerans]|uniref:Invasion associated locus B (IalB) protein n=1 Tax=Methyloligella halotolerans TaxID=1177755 RepID=A0A1E2S2T1_9HYPH|nr:invasion associated locus B family protein [Methyloligella halotolerans]ODA68635.1 Invasion associated locus B (IalB) protein [Methyloligella halotolerans]